MKHKSFLNFLRHHNDNGPGIISWVSRYLLGGRGKRKLDCDLGDDLSAWMNLASTAPKAYRDAMIAGVKQAFSEYEKDRDRGVKNGIDNSIEIRSTVGRLEKAIKMNMEDGRVSNEETLMVSRFVGPVAQIGTSAKLTVSLGDFESVSVMKSINVPCYVEEVDLISEISDKWIDREIGKELANIVSLKTGSTISIPNSKAINTDGKCIGLRSSDSPTVNAMSGVMDDSIDSEEDGEDIVDEVIYDDTNSDIDKDDVLF